MVAVFTVLIVLSLSIVIVRVATTGLAMTGLSKDLAQFQALSAFTGSGFTTRESEEIVNHPVRRRIVMHLMLLGNAGIVIAVASVAASLLHTDTTEHWTKSWWFRILVLAAGVVVLWTITSSRYVDQAMWHVNRWALSQWSHLEVHDYTRLLRLARNYVIWEMQIQSDNWLAGLTLSNSALASEGVLVLGIERSDGKYLGAPRGDTCIEPGDQLILYGQQDALLDLDRREHGMIGNLHHVMAVTKQLEVLEDEREIAHLERNRE